MNCISISEKETLTLGRIDKGAKCNVSGCGKEAVRSLSLDKVRSSGLSVNVEGRRAYLCKGHYKEYKKRTKKEKQLEKWRHMG
ncbi:MAG: hypothetical protein QXJ53_00515 [Candidatus Bathyarchaeia archaeon]